MTPNEVLNLPMERNDSGANTIRGYLVALVAKVWEEDESFSGKRPFGNSGWTWDLYPPLIAAGVIAGKLDEDGYIDECDDAAGHKVITDAIKALAVDQ